MMTISKTKITEITTLHDEIAAAMNRSVQSAIRIGEILTEAKGGLKHGEWLPWIKEHLPFSDQTARNYMRLHEHKDKFKTVLSLKDAYQMMVPEKAERIQTLIKDDIHEYLLCHFGIKPDATGLGDIIKEAEEFEADFNNYILQSVGVHIPWRFPYYGDLKNVHGLIYCHGHKDTWEEFHNYSYRFTELFKKLRNFLTVRALAWIPKNTDRDSSMDKFMDCALSLPDPDKCGPASIIEFWFLWRHYIDSRVDRVPNEYDWSERAGPFPIIIE